jgi:uncharacterized membrane protein
VTSPVDDLGALVTGRAPTAPPRQPSRTQRGHLSPRARKAALTAHIAVSGTWLGAVVANVFLGISAAVTGNETLANSYYATMDRLANNLMPAAAITTLATGLLLALATRWGLFRHWWTIAKLVLAILTVVVGVAIIDSAIRDTITARTTTGHTEFSQALLPATILTPLLLLTATVIAVTKPWGRTSRGRRRATSSAGRAPSTGPHTTARGTR